MVRHLVLVAMLGIACDREPPTAPPPQTPPGPRELAPVTAARAEFELVSPDLRAGTDTMYFHRDFLADGAMDPHALDEGDFIGRARTLFGPPNEPRDGGYVLRHRSTGLIVTIDGPGNGSSYGAVPRRRDPATPDELAAWRAQIAADPVLASGPPSSSSATGQGARAFSAAEATYTRHFHDLVAGPALAAVVARLDALLSAVEPSDWETTVVYAADLGVMRIGVRAGTSFAEPLDPVASIEWLLARAKEADDRESQARYDKAVLQYLRVKPGLAAYRARALPSLARLEAAAAAEPDVYLRDALKRQAQELRAALY